MSVDEGPDPTYSAPRAARARKLRYGGNAAVAILAFAGIIVILNLAAQARFRRWDWTDTKIYSLSDKTAAILKGLTTDIDITVLLQPDAEMYDAVHELLSNYRARSPHLKVEFLDPAKEPARVGQLLEKFGIDPRGDSTAVVFSAGERHKHVSVAELADYDFSAATMGGPPRVKGFKGEAAFTQAVLSVTESRQRGVCFLKGHDEASTDDGSPGGLSAAVEALERENMKVESTDILGRGPLSDSCNLLVIAGPTRSFTPPEADALGAFLDGGGRLLALIDPPFSREKTLQRLGIESVLLARGAALGDDIVLDPTQRLLFGSAETFAANDFLPHAITKGLESTFIVLGLARSSAPVEPAPAGWTVSPLARTTDRGWAKRDLTDLRAVQGPNDLAGPVCFAVAAEKKLEGDQLARVVVVGDSDFARNQFLSAAANLDFLLNAVNWLVGSEQQIGIGPREPEQVHLSMTGRQETMVFVATFLGLPGCAILAGIIVWLFRRR